MSETTEKVDYEKYKAADTVESVFLNHKNKSFRSTSYDKSLADMISECFDINGVHACQIMRHIYTQANKSKNDKSNGWMWETQEQIAERFGFGRHYVAKTMKPLRGVDLILSRKTGKYKKKIEYKINDGRLGMFIQMKPEYRKKVVAEALDKIKK